MIAKIIEFCARNKFAVFLLMALAIIWGYLGREEHAPRRPSGPERYAGDHLYGMDGAQPRSGGRSDHLSDYLHPAGRPESPGGARFFLFRQFLHLRHF